MYTMSAKGYCYKWGSDFGAREIFGLSKEEKAMIDQGEDVRIEAPLYKGQATRRVIRRGKRYYARMPK